MRARLIIALALSIVAFQSSAAQQSPSSKKASSEEASSKGVSTGDKPAVSQTEKDAVEARTRKDAQDRAWDEKMKRTMRSICSGANGC